MAAETAPAVKTAVIAKRLNGERKSKIARDLGLSKPTVYKILEESQVDQLTVQAKSILYEALPEAAQTISRAVKKSPVHAFELLDRTGVMPKNSEGATVNVALAVGELPSAFHGKAEDSDVITVNQSD
jgi:transposase-like protein